MPHDTGPPSEITLEDACADAAEVVERLRHGLGWARVLMVPGREPRPAPPVLPDHVRERLAAQSRVEWAEREDARRDPAAGLGVGTTVPAPGGGAASAAPVAVALLDVQELVARVVRQLVLEVEAAGDGRVRFGSRIGTVVEVVDALDWLAGSPAPVWAVTPAGVVRRWCVLGDVGKPRLAGDVAAALGRLAERVRAAVGILTDRVLPWPGGRCPACRLRTLEIDVTLRDPQWWTVRCISEACRCTGVGCPCRRRLRYEGRPHAWSGAELDGPYGLRRAIEAAAASRRPVRSGMEGRGA